MSRHYIRAGQAGEADEVTSWHGTYQWRAGVRRLAKRRYNKRERRYLNALLDR